MTKAGQMESKGCSKILRERRSLFFKVYFVKIKTLNFLFKITQSVDIQSPLKSLKTKKSKEKLRKTKKNQEKTKKTKKNQETPRKTKKNHEKPLKSTKTA